MAFIKNKGKYLLDLINISFSVLLKNSYLKGEYNHMSETNIEKYDPDLKFLSLLTSVP